MRLENTPDGSLQRGKTPPTTTIQDMTQCDGETPCLGNIEHIFVTIAPRFTLNWSGIIPVKVLTMGQIELFNHLLETI